MKRRYRRYFIIMDHEDSGYEVSNNQSPKGHAKVEVSNDKGKMVLHCQNLKDLSEKRMRYRWYLVNTNKEEPTIVDIGPMEVDENGKGEITWEFNGENVKATKESIDDFNLLTMLVESTGDNKKIVAPLVGYIDKEKFDWREILETKLFGNTTSNSFSKKTKQEKSQQIPKPITEIKPKKDPKPLPVKEEKVVREDKGIVEEQKPQVEKPVQEKKEMKKTPMKETPIKEMQPKGVPKSTEESQIVGDKSKEMQYITKPQADKEPFEAKEVQKEGKTNKEMKPQRPMSNPYGAQSILKSLQGYIETTVKMFPKVNPFEEPLANYHWWHIYYNQQTMYRAHMPFIGYIDGAKYPTQYYPYQYPTDCQRQVYQYQHYLFGIVYDDNKEVKYYVYGIPGRKTKSEQPYGGKTGFDYWKSCRRGKVDDRTQGYWLLHIDPKTGGVVKP